MHRFVRVDDDGLLVTRGDANNADDSTPVALDAVVGIGTLRVPWIALPIVWLREGPVALPGPGRGRLSPCSSSSRRAAVTATFADDDPTDGDAPAEARRRSPRPDGRARRRALRPRAPMLRAGGRCGGRRRCSAACLAAPVAEASVQRHDERPAARWPPRTYFTCANAVAAFAPYFSYRMDETSSTTTTATDSSGNARTGVYGVGREDDDHAAKACSQRHRAGDDLQRLERLPELTRRARRHAHHLQPDRSGSARPRTSGGKLIGFGSAQTGASGTYDRHVYMANSGRVVLRRLRRTRSRRSPRPRPTTTAPGTWRSASLSSRRHAALRRRRPRRLRHRPRPRPSRGPRRTCGSPTTTSDNWDSTPTSRFFAGTLDDAAYFTSALTAAQVPVPVRGGRVPSLPPARHVPGEAGEWSAARASGS